VSAIAVAYFRDAILQTLGIVCASLIIALLVGTPLAYVIARGGRIGRAVSTATTVVRAIPDLVLAIVFVVALGLGPGPAIVALGAHYAAVIAKMFSDVVGAVRREPAEALIATGATTGASLLIGAVPAAWPGIVGFGVYAFESIMRASVIVGVVGAGGLGSILIQQLNMADYRTFSITVVILAVLIAAIEALGTYFRLRATPRAIAATLVAIAAGGVLAFAFAPDPPWRMLATAPEHIARFVAGAMPQIDPDIVGTAFSGVVQCVLVALSGTVLGAILAIPLSLLIAWPVARGWMRGTGWRPASWVAEIAARVVLTSARAVPPIAMGLIGVILIGIGPLAGAFALTIHTAGVLGKLLAESFDVADRAPAEALVANGATGTAATLIALVPAACGAMLAHTLYRFEWNVRASTALGMVGAGGLGQAIFNAQQLLFYRQLSTYVLVAVALVLIVDALGARLRAGMRLERLAVER
jgi:phosphonate transport system permease protein